MRLTTRDDWPVEAATAYQRLADFPALKAALVEQQIEVTDGRPGDASGQGLVWRLAFGLKGLRREMDLEVTQVTPESGFVLQGQSDGITADIRVIIRPLAPERCEVLWQIDLGARGFAARLMLQPLHLARPMAEHKLGEHLGRLTRRRLGL